MVLSISIWHETVCGLVFFFLGHHLAPGHPKDPEDHDPDPLKSQGKNPGLSPVLLTDLTRSQRKANTDNVNIFYDAVTLTGNAVLFLCLNSLLKNKKAFLTFFFVNARVYSWVSASVDLSLFYIVQNIFIVTISQKKHFCV